MKNVKRGLKIVGLSAVATMMLAACGGRGNKENTSDKVDPMVSAQIAKINRGIDSLNVLRDDVRAQRTPFLKRVDATRDEINDIAAKNGKLYVLALADYAKRVNNAYPIKTTLSASDAKYFSNLAKKILARADKADVLAESAYIDLDYPSMGGADWLMQELGMIPSDVTVKHIGPAMILPEVMFLSDAENGIAVYEGEHGTFLILNVKNPIEAVRRVANGTGTVMDIEVMVRATTFGEMGMSRAEIAELKKYVLLARTNGVLLDTPAGRAVSQCIAKMNETSVAGLVNDGRTRIWQETHTPESDRLNIQISKLERRIENSDFRNMSERDTAIKTLAELRSRSQEIENRNNKRADAMTAELAQRAIDVDPNGVGVNFSIPEMQKIKPQFMDNVAKIKELHHSMAPDNAKLDSLNRVSNKYYDELQKLHEAKNKLREKQK